MEILTTFHTRVKYIYVILPIQTNGGTNDEKCQKPCQKQPLPLKARGPLSNTSMPGRTLKGIRIQSAVSPQYTLRTDRQTDGPSESSVT